MPVIALTEDKLEQPTDPNEQCGFLECGNVGDNGDPLVVMYETEPPRTFTAIVCIRHMMDCLNAYSKSPHTLVTWIDEGRIKGTWS